MNQNVDETEEYDEQINKEFKPKIISSINKAPTTKIISFNKNSNFDSENKPDLVSEAIKEGSSNFFVFILF